MPELYPDAVEGPYTVPSGTDIADGPQAFRDFADSLGGLSDTLEVFELAGDHTVTAVEMGGLFTHSGSGMTLTVNAGEHPVGSVMAVSNLSDEADAVVTVETPNLTETVGQYAIMSFTQVSVDVWVPNGGGAGGGGLKWAKDIESEADLAGLDAEVVAAQEPDLTLWMRCGTGPWREMCSADGSGSIGAAVISGATGTVSKSSITGDGTTGVSGQDYDIYRFTGSGEITVAADGAGDAEVFVLGGGAGSGVVNGSGAGAGGGGGSLLQHPMYLPAGTYTVAIGGGGGLGGRGGKSHFKSKTGSEVVVEAAGGGQGGNYSSGGGVGACGGGSGTYNGSGGAGLLGGNGGNGATSTNGGGGGGGVGGAANKSIPGNGIYSYVTGSKLGYGGGGGGGDQGSNKTSDFGGGMGGGNGQNGTNGAANRGGGGGGGGWAGKANGTGGSGLVIVRVRVASGSFPFGLKEVTPDVAHAALIEDDVVKEVIVIPHLDNDDAKITAYCNSIGLPGTWVDTSYTGSRRGKYASVGDTFADGEFVSPEIEAAD